MKYFILVNLLLLNGLAPGSDPPASTERTHAPQSQTSQASGILQWATAVATAWDRAALAKTAPELRRAYGTLSELYRDCSGCRARMVKSLRNRLDRQHGDVSGIRQVLEVELANDPVSLGSLMVETGRPEEAIRIVKGALGQTRFRETELELLEILAEAHMKLGDTRQARRLAKKLLDENLISPNYCEKALKWWTWVNGEAAPTEEYLHPKEYRAKFEHLRELERTRGNEPYVSCLFNHYLLQLDRLISGTKAVGVQVPVEVTSLFPEGIDVELQRLARRTPDAKTRAAILLGVAKRVYVGNAATALALVREAKAAGPQKTIKIGALKMELGGLFLHEHREEFEQIALSLVNEYPEYEASCSGCVSYWRAITYPWSEYSSRIETWRQKCGNLMSQCSTERWQEISYSYPNEPLRAIEMYEALHASNLPVELVPVSLLRLGSALRNMDPDRSWRLEREAIRHPEFPGLDSTIRPGLQERAEAAGDFETALYLDLLAGHTITFGCGLIGGDRSAEVIPDFRRAYYELQLGINPRERWQDLVGMLQKAPQEREWRGLHSEFFLDRLVKASTVVHEESSTLNWLRGLREQYKEAIKEAHDSEPDHREEASLTKAESIISTIIKRMETETKMRSANTF